MSVQSPSESDEKRVPLGIVFLVIGFIILGVVLTIWVLKPAMMPQPLYDLASGFLPRTIPTPVAPVAAPDIPALLPEMPTQDDDEMPDYFISAAEAAQRDPDVGEPVRIVIPQINLDAPVSETGLEQIDSAGQTYYQWMVPGGYTAGWHDNSARLGEPGNTVLNGHHNIHGEVFRDLVDLEEGDEIILHDASQTYIYQVTVKEILPESNQPLSVRVENAQWIAPTDDERVTLVTCWPYTDNSHRLVIVAEPVEETDL